MKKTLIWLLVIIVVIGGIVLIVRSNQSGTSTTPTTSPVAGTDSDDQAAASPTAGVVVPSSSPWPVLFTNPGANLTMSVNQPITVSWQGNANVPTSVSDNGNLYLYTLSGIKIENYNQSTIGQKPTRKTAPFTVTFKPAVVTPGSYYFQLVDLNGVPVGRSATFRVTI